MISQYNYEGDRWVALHVERNLSWQSASDSLTLPDLDSVQPPIARIFAVTPSVKAHEDHISVAVSIFRDEGRHHVEYFSIVHQDCLPRLERHCEYWQPVCAVIDM